MSVFTHAEPEYLASQRLGRLATVDEAGQPYVVPVAFRHNPDEDTIHISGRPPISGRKYYGNVKTQDRAALVVDDVLPRWSPRAVQVRGQAEVLPTGGKGLGEYFDDEVIRIRPRRIISWGLEGQDRSARTV